MAFFGTEGKLHVCESCHEASSLLECFGIFHFAHVYFSQPNKANKVAQEGLCVISYSTATIAIM